MQVLIYIALIIALVLEYSITDSIEFYNISLFNIFCNLSRSMVYPHVKFELINTLPVPSESINCNSFEICGLNDIYILGVLKNKGIYLL